MRISFSPQRRNDVLEIYKQGDIITINGEEFDFTDLPNGATLPLEAIDSEWFVSSVKRNNGGIEFTLILPHGPNPTPEQAFPQTIVNPPNGKIKLPENVVPEPIEEASEDVEND